MQIKEWPNWLIVDETIDTDDNSVVTLHPDTIEKLQFSRGDTILIQGKERKDTICIALCDETCEESRIKLNEVIRSNLKVGHGGIVWVDLCKDVEYGKHVTILPLDDTIQDWDVIFDAYLKPYFLECYRPLRKGDYFLVRGRSETMRSVEFKVMETDPAEYCIVCPDTEIFIDGVVENPIQRRSQD